MSAEFRGGKAEGATQPVRIAELTRSFIQTRVIPIDDAHDGDIALAGGDALRLDLQASAREIGIFAPHAPTEYGGLGFGMRDRARVFEEAGYSLFGPIALNIAAPDEGNVHLLAAVADERQSARYLAPLARGEKRSAFAMTEPPPGAGADPAALATTAARVDGGYLINGTKRFITGADGADFLIVMARTSGQAGEAGGATMFLVDATARGYRIDRHVPTTDKSMLGGHCELSFVDVLVSDDSVLGGVDEGFRYAQVRLGPARMTHVMRWLGAARRAHETAIRYVIDRESFGGRLSEQGMIQQLIADNEIDLAATRALLLTACDVLDGGGNGSLETSIAKTFAAEALGRVADRATQMCGGLGVSSDLPVAKIARELRPFRIYDGPSEVHRWSIARKAISSLREPRS